jgi:glycosyltransferase involved in cell wall biosynthesis
VRQLATAYRAFGDSVEVACLDNPNEIFLADIPCPVHALGPSYLGRYGLSFRLWRWLNRNACRFDAIVMNGIWIFPNLAVWFSARRAHKPFGVFIHGALDPWFNRKYPLKHLKKLLYWPLQHTVLSNAQAVFFATGKELDLAKTSFSPSQWNSVVVPYGINDPEMCETSSEPRNADGAKQVVLHAGTSAEQVEAFYRRMPELRDRRFLLFLGRIHEKKGCDLLLQAIAKTTSSVPEVDLLIAGPDKAGMQAKLQRLAEKLGIASRVHWLGLIGDDLKWGAFRACEAFVLPSHQENFGIAVVEALAMGRPVLISNQVNIFSDIERDGAGLIEDDTPEGTERLLRRWFKLSAAERDGMSSRARASFLRRFAIGNTAAVIGRQLASSRLESKPVPRQSTPVAESHHRDAFALRRSTLDNSSETEF